MNKGFIFFLPLIIGTFLSIFGFVWYRTAITPPGSSSQKVQVVINKGASVEKIGKVLDEAGVIKSAFAFKLLAQLNEKTKLIPPGEFLVPQNISMEEVFELLLKGPEEYWVTIPEGLRREEVPEKFISALNLTGDDATNFRSKFLADSKGLEGYLFPDSYLFPPEIDAGKVVDRLRDTFYSKTGEDFEANAALVNLTLGEAVVLASLLERETVTDAERPVVAGIMFNRMKAGMPLQVDASVQYATANKRCRANSINCDWWVVPTRNDWEVGSPFNTYKNLGLPPSPIASPGISALMAVVHPEATEYYYYIHDDEGTIHYGITLDDHNANVQKYLH